jgi:hypothetical protein
LDPNSLICVDKNNLKTRINEEYSSKLISKSTIIKQETYLNPLFDKVPKCQVKENDKCSYCKLGYFLKDGECEPCIANCIKCTNSVDCLLCGTGFHLVNIEGQAFCLKSEVNLFL